MILPEANPDQQAVIDAAVNWYNNSSEQVFQFSGGPGTGKSFTLNKIIHALGIPYHDVMAMSYIGAAAIVMRLKGFTNAKTMHSWLFDPIEEIMKDDSGAPIMDPLYNRPKVKRSFIEKDFIDENIKLIVIDEAGSMPLKYKRVIEKHGIKIIATGDVDQLPPVQDTPAYLYTGKVYRINQIMRQAENSSIVYLSRRALQGLPIHTGFYGDSLVITEDDITEKMVLNSDVIICGKNYTRDYWNRKIRQELLHINSPTPMFMEKVVCAKNNWNIEVSGISLANGLPGRVVNNPDPSGFDSDTNTFTMDFLPDMLGEPFKGLHASYDYMVSDHERRNSLKSDRYCFGEKFEFGYALTTHKAQGSQWANGIYFEEFLQPSINNNLHYTAISRFSNTLIYVKKKSKYI